MYALNLARKWRCKCLATVKGQRLTIRFLQNSLYKNIIYPVYLFSGMRGTGKTTVARIFAASVLCKNLSSFQADPSSILPCYACDSCEAFAAERHPDIIEIDAASHTGVDMIRSLIEHSYLLPVLASKKIYIIDEVHMLSKAAFNACLKIMEEPPAHVHFILATTDPNKVIDTVRSRSIRLYFDSLSSDDVVSNLEAICQAEGIVYTKRGLESVFQASQGSMRDAINHVERIRYMCDVVDEDTVAQCLGIPPQALVEDFVECFIAENYEKICATLEHLKNYSLHAQAIWSLLCGCVRERLVWSIIRDSRVHQRLVMLLELLYTYESLYMNSALPYGMLELIFHQGFVQREVSAVTVIDQKPVRKPLTQQLTQPREPGRSETTARVEQAAIKEVQKVALPTVPLFTEERLVEHASCAQFVEKIHAVDTVLASLMRQALMQFDSSKNILNCTFDRKFLFYRDFIDEKKQLWAPVLRATFGEGAVLCVEFSELVVSGVAVLGSENPGPERGIARSAPVQPVGVKKSVEIVAAHGPDSLAHEVARLFPGKTEKVSL